MTIDQSRSVTQEAVGAALDPVLDGPGPHGVSR